VKESISPGKVALQQNAAPEGRNEGKGKILQEVDSNLENLKAITPSR
jgi:hypothetical protein